MIYSDIVNYFEDQQVTDFSINMGTGEMRLTLNDESKTIINYYGAERRPMLLEEIQPYMEEYNENHPGCDGARISAPAETSWLTSMIPMLLVLVVGVVLVVHDEAPERHHGRCRQADELRQGQD